MRVNDEAGGRLKEGTRSNCVISTALDIMGDRWTLLVIRDMLFFGKKEYNEFIDAPEGISTNILANRLKRLVETGICTRRSHPSDGKKILYELTEAGADLAPVLVELGVWSEKHTCGRFMAEEVGAEIERDKTGFCDSLIANAQASRK